MIFPSHQEGTPSAGVHSPPSIALCAAVRSPPYPLRPECLLFLPWAMAVSWCSRGCRGSPFSPPRAGPLAFPPPIVSTQGALFACRHMCCLSPALACELLETRGGPGLLGAFSRACVWLGGGLAASSRPPAPVGGWDPPSLLSALPPFRWLLGLAWGSCSEGKQGTGLFQEPCRHPAGREDVSRVSLCKEQGDGRGRPGKAIGCGFLSPAPTLLGSSSSMGRAPHPVDGLVEKRRSPGLWDIIFSV